MINKKLDSEKNSQLNNRYIKQNTDTKNNMNIKVNINANITNTMNGRVISRELQKVNNTNDFAFNR